MYDKSNKENGKVFFFKARKPKDFDDLVKTLAKLPFDRLEFAIIYYYISIEL